MAVDLRSGRFNIVSVEAIIRTVHMQADGLKVYSFRWYLVMSTLDRLVNVLKRCCPTNNQQSTACEKKITDSRN
jgi:hypothetical protein